VKSVALDTSSTLLTLIDIEVIKRKRENKMKKLLAVIAVALLSRFSFADPSNIGTEPPSAGWNFGNVTYGQEGGSLVLNSLSDRYGVSTFQTANTNGQSIQLLGTNDYIPESAVKNQLAIDGYTAAYDYNPNYKGLYASEYNQSLPTNVPLTELSFEGLAGDPTAIQNVYVPTSEYNALSAQGQAASINTLNNGLATTNASLAGTQNMTDNSVITNTVKANTAGIVALNTGLNNETVRAQGAEAGLQNQVNATNSKVANLDNRVDQLEKVKVMADLNVRILDTKKYTVGVFDMWDGTNNRNFAFGARLTYKLGKSYEEKVLEKQQLQIEALERVLNKIANQ
jgi:hypothetical protein